MSSTAVAKIVADLIALALNTALRYNALQQQAASEGRQVNLVDLRVLQGELRNNQAELDALIQAMPDESSDD